VLKDRFQSGEEFKCLNFHPNVLLLGRDSSVSIATGWSGDQVPVGAKFPASMQTGPGDHPASCTVGTGSLFPGVKRLGRAGDHPPPYRPRLNPKFHVRGVLYRDSNRMKSP
jgi:hypothetical protein